MTQNTVDLQKIVMFPFKVLWSIGVVGVSIWLEVLWLGFLFSTIILALLVLLFAPKLFIAPLNLCLLASVPWVSETE